MILPYRHNVMYKTRSVLYDRHKTSNSTFRCCFLNGQEKEKGEEKLEWGFIPLLLNLEMHIHIKDTIPT